MTAMPTHLIPEAPVTREELAKWFKMKQDMEVLKAAEMELRKRIVRAMIADPVEGTNKSMREDLLGPDHHFVVQHKVDRKVDDELIVANLAQLRAAKIDPKKLVRHKPELIKSAYNLLTAEQKQVFDQCLDIKDGAPSLEIKAGRI